MYATLEVDQVYYEGEGPTFDEAIASLEANYAELRARREPKGDDIYSLARKVVEENPQWYAGQTREVWKGKTSKVTIYEHGRDGGGLLTLEVRNGKATRVQCGHLDPFKGGWVWTLSQSEYKRWVERAQGV